MLSHREQKYLPYMVVIVDFCRILLLFKVPTLREAITFTYRYRHPQITKSEPIKSILHLYL